MKLSIQPFQSDRTGYRYVRCVAVIPKSKKLGIPKQFQKTWKVRTVAPNFSAEEMRHSFEANARRWQEKVMAKIKNVEVEIERRTETHPF